MKALRKSPGNITIATLAVLLMVGGVVSAQAQGPGPGRGGQGRCGDGPHGPEMRMERMTERLDLTTDQVQAIQKIREDAQTANQELRKEIMRLRNEKHGEMLKDEPATKTVLALTKKMGEAKTKLQLNRMASRLEVRKLLTPAQRDKMLMAGGQAGRRGPQGRGGHRGGGCDKGHGGHGGRNGKCTSAR